MLKKSIWLKLSICFLLLLNIGAQSQLPEPYIANNLDPQACPGGELPLFMGGTCTGGGPVRASINAAIADASDGWTVWIDVGAFSENVVIDKRITLRGSGSGVNPASNTVITSASTGTAVIQITVPGTLSEPITIMDLRATGAFGVAAVGNNVRSGFHLRGTGIQNIIMDNIASVNNAGHGIAVDTSGGDVLNITIKNSDISNNGSVGFKIPSSASSAKGLVIENSTIDNNAQCGIIINYQPGEPTEIKVTDTTLTGNGGFGAPSGGDGGIVLYQGSGAAAANDITAEFTNVKITGPAAVVAGQTSGFYVNARTNNTTSGTYNFNNVEISGNHHYDIRFRRFADTSGINMNYVRAFGNSAYGVIGVDVAGGLDLDNTQFSNTHTNFDISLSGSNGDINALNASFLGATTLPIVQARVEDSPPPETGVVIVTLPDTTAPQVANTSLNATMPNGPTQVEVTFIEDVLDMIGDTGADDVTNAINYFLIQMGPNGAYDTLSCLGGLQGDDLSTSIDIVAYDNSSFKATVSINGGAVLPDGKYRFLVCGTTSIVDLSDNSLAGAVDFSFDFIVGDADADADAIAVAVSGGAPGFSLPETGFLPGMVFHLPIQPASKEYNDLGAVWLEIPSLAVELPIIGVPVVEGEWDVTWLSNQAGYLEGTAFPTWAGNTVLTAHVWDANNNPGPFSKLKSLKYGDVFYIHAFGQVYTYAVQNSQQVLPNDLGVLGHSDYDRVTLLTCESYSKEGDGYKYRRAVTAVLVDVGPEK